MAALKINVRCLFSIALLFLSQPICLVSADLSWLASLFGGGGGEGDGDKAAVAIEPPAPQEPRPLVTVPLTKQYVPVKRNGNVVAYKTAYFGELFVGTPARRFTAVFDTGSGHLILPSARCRSEGCARHTTYDHRLSSSSIELEHDGRPITPETNKRDQVSITFGTGKVKGEFAEDQACVGTPGTTAENCFKLRIVVANDMSAEPFALFDFDGVLGLGLSALALNPHFSFFGNMVQQHPGMQPMFSCFLARNEAEGTSSISFGGYEEKYVASEFEWAPVKNPELGYWQVQIQRVRVGDTVLPGCSQGECVAVLDTGTSLLGVPKAAAPQLHSLLARSITEEQAQDGKVDCRGLDGPLLEFDLFDGTREFTISLTAEDHSRPAPVNMRLFSQPAPAAAAAPATASTNPAATGAGSGDQQPAPAAAAAPASGAQSQEAATATAGREATLGSSAKQASETKAPSQPQAPATGASAAAAPVAAEKQAAADGKAGAAAAEDTPNAADLPPQWMCRSLLLPVAMESPLGAKMFIWGEPMLRKYYTVYDWGRNRVGFATAQRFEAPPSDDASAAKASAIGVPQAGNLLVGAPLASAAAAKPN
eukprot:TRINITY_DN11266_c0_g1_i1.p1 TRINITY_DN11266_c0_g1~~TRINITY_DN11266_c0_g1_i1.p1  ORF type:complete len:626 (+),score=130.37 TRINITY_DN11266_c0_g1_i1:95-1879(+)